MKRRRTNWRARGFNLDWTPQPHRKELIEDVNEIIRDHKDIAPLTLRQIFYMLVVSYGYEKTSAAYQSLSETVNQSRRAMMIRMDAIRNDELIEKHTKGWESCERFRYVDYCVRKHFLLNRQTDQKIKTFIWCETRGMVPQIAAAVKDYHIPVLSSGGFDSTTTKHNFAQRVSKLQDTVVLHIGDHDPSGTHIFSSLEEDVTAFWQHYTIGENKSLRFIRLAVTPQQIEDMQLPIMPPKETDNRSFEGMTTQCEAIPPKRLREIVQKGVREHINLKTFGRTLKKEKEISEDLSKFLELFN